MSLLGTVGLLVVVLVHTALTAVATRYIRLRLRTSWGRALYAGLLVPVLLVVTTIVLTGGLGLGGTLDRQTALLVVLVLPLTLGYAIDLFWMPAPDEIELPDTTDARDRSRR
jgi:hypothetical protein